MVAAGLKSGRPERYRSKINRAWLLRVKDDAEACVGHTEMGGQEEMVWVESR